MGWFSSIVKKVSAPLKKVSNTLGINDVLSGATGGILGGGGISEDQLNDAVNAAKAEASAQAAEQARQSRVSAMANSRQTSAGVDTKQVALGTDAVDASLEDQLKRLRK